MPTKPPPARIDAALIPLGAAAEEAAHQDAAALAYVPASVAVGLVGQRIADALDRAPAPVPTRRLPKSKRRR